MPSGCCIDPRVHTPLAGEQIERKTTGCPAHLEQDDDAAKKQEEIHLFSTTPVLFRAKQPTSYVDCGSTRRPNLSIPHEITFQVRNGANMLYPMNRNTFGKVLYHLQGEHNLRQPDFAG